VHIIDGGGESVKITVGTVGSQCMRQVLHSNKPRCRVKLQHGILVTDRLDLSRGSVLKYNYFKER